MCIRYINSEELLQSYCHNFNRKENSWPRKISIINRYNVTIGEMTQTISIHIRRSDSCISNGEEKRVWSRGETPVPIPTQEHDAGPDQGEVQLVPQPSDTE